MLLKDDVVKYFESKNFTLLEINSILLLCPIILDMPIEEIEKKVTILYNGASLYAIIICDQNNYRYYLSRNNEHNHFKDLEVADYVIQMVISSTRKQYLQKIVGIEPGDTLEDSLYKMKQLKFNSTGYQIK